MQKPAKIGGNCCVALPCTFLHQVQIQSRFAILFKEYQPPSQLTPRALCGATPRTLHSLLGILAFQHVNGKPAQIGANYCVALPRSLPPRPTRHSDSNDQSTDTNSQEFSSEDSSQIFDSSIFEVITEGMGQNHNQHRAQNQEMLIRKLTPFIHFGFKIYYGLFWG